MPIQGAIDELINARLRGRLASPENYLFNIYIY